MQELYDEMLPGITERQAPTPRRWPRRWREVADVDAGEPACKDRDGIERRCASSRRAASTGCSW